MWGNLFAEIFLKFVGPVLATAIMTLVTGLLTRMMKRYHLGILNGLKNHLVNDVNVAVLAQENKAADYCLATGNKIHGGQTFENVLEGLVRVYPGVDPHEIEDLIHATVLSTPGIGPIDLIPRTEAQNAAGIAAKQAGGGKPAPDAHGAAGKAAAGRADPVVPDGPKKPVGGPSTWTHE